MKKFYQSATASEVESGFAVHLDARPVRTPAKMLLVLPTRALAEAIAAEWQAQEETIRPTTMPLMQLASTTLDLTTRQRDAVIRQVAAYAGTDLLCYRVERPEDLIAREAATWQPLLEWTTARFGAALEVGRGVMPRSQPDDACAALRAAVAAYDDWRLTALQLATTAAGSLVIGLALMEERLDSERAFEASELHETYQIERWGEDPESIRRRSALKADLKAARLFFDLLRA